MMPLSNRNFVFLAVLLLNFFYLVQGGDSACWAKNGRCQNTSEACFSYRTGLCGGGAARQCCVSGADINCWRIRGTCKNKSNPCSGRYYKGLCGGGLSRQCCA